MFNYGSLLHPAPSQCNRKRRPDPIPSRLNDILDDRVFSFAQAAQAHFKTNDLVVVLDFREESPELQALPRQRLAETDEMALDIRLKLSRPASELKDTLGSPDQTFWFLVIYEDEDCDCGAVNASMLLAPGVTRDVAAGACGVRSCLQN